MATGDDLELGTTNSANNTTHLAANVSHAIGFLVTNGGAGGTTNPVTAIEGQADEIGVRGFGGVGVAGGTFKGIGVEGKATSGTGVLGDAKTGIGVRGTSGGSRSGVRGFSVSGHGVEGESGGNRRTLAGVLGESVNSNGVRGTSQGRSGVRGESRRAEGVFGIGQIGVWGDGNLGVLGIGQNPQGVGVWGGTASLQGVGVRGTATHKSGLAGVFDGNVTVSGDFDVTGAKGAAVAFPDGSRRRLYSLESPESWFEDFGEKKLVRGKAEVTVDPGFAAVVRGEYHIFITPYGDSNGLYVSRRSRRRFVVREQNAGNSTLTFSYRLVARRKDIAGPRLQKVTMPIKRPVPPARAQKKT